MTCAKRAQCRSAKSGQFKAASPLDDPSFLGGVRLFVQASDSLVPLLQSIADRGEQQSLHVRQLRAVVAMLDGMATNMAGQLVARGERLIFPPPVDFIRAGFDWGDPDDHDVLEQCVRWHRDAAKLQWFFKQISDIVQTLPASHLASLSEEDRFIDAIASGLVQPCLLNLQKLLIERLKKSSDKEYLKDAKKSVLLLPMFKKPGPSLPSSPAP